MLSALTLFALLTLTLLALLPFLTFLSLLLSFLLTLLLPLLIALAPVGPFIQTTSQRVEIVSKLPRAIEILLRTRTIRALRALLSRLQALGNTIQTALDLAFIVATTAALLILLSLLPTAIQHLLTFANPIRDTIARERISRFFQLARRTLLALATSGHRARRLFKILLQAVDAVGQRVFALAELVAGPFRVFILLALTATTREVLHVFRDLALSRSRLRRTLSQLADLLLTSRRS